MFGEQKKLNPRMYPYNRIGIFVLWMLFVEELDLQMNYNIKNIYQENEENLKILSNKDFCKILCFKNLSITYIQFYTHEKHKS